MKLRNRVITIDLSDYHPWWESDRLQEIEDRFTKLATWEQNLIYLYAHLGSYQKVANHLLVQKSTVWYAICRIKRKLEIF